MDNGATHYIFEGDFGGQIMMTIPISDSISTDIMIEALRVLNKDQWDGEDGASVYDSYAEPEDGDCFPGGMGGGHLLKGVWFHPAITESAKAKVMGILAKGGIAYVD